LIDRMNVDCDLFDDAIANGSCLAPVPVLHKCTLLSSNPPISSASRIDLYTEGAGILHVRLIGSLDIGANGPYASCSIQSLNPVNIIGIGFVCISPGSTCPVGTRYCGPGGAGTGPWLGIDSQSDGIAGGPCSANTTCATTCASAAQCGSVSNTLTAACTGYCTGTTPVNMACSSDNQCLLATNGSCNGGDPVNNPPNSLPNICQCSCIDTSAHGPSDPGDFQCNLGSNIVVETGSPCDGTDILVSVGNTCIPFTSERATGLITQSNINAGKTCTGGFCDNSPTTACTSAADCPDSVVPVPPNVNDQTGVPLACATVDMSTTTGIVGVGAVNFFGSALGDLSVALRSQCM
jgi:hypothetical protein